ncbi:MAG: hypothetical protein QXN87_04955 [Candidatus Bathyarchaeia archaeon]
MKDKRKEVKQNVEELMKIIRWLDDYRTFRVANPATIEKSILAVCPSNIVMSWRRVKKDIDAMNDALAKGPLRKFIALVALLRTVTTTIMLGFVALFFVVVLFRVSLQLSYNMVVLIILACLVVVPNSYLYLDRYLRLKIQEHHESLGSKFSSRMGKVTDFAQQLIFHMNNLIKNSKLDPRENQFRLRHCDYDGLVVVKKRRFSGIYTVMPLIEFARN